ncbi:MAG: PA0069 family radical SAM protein [Bacteroidetes bacterium]|nr:PA0069 family radical SAM protein [Bacteroidota bacterium]
MDYIKGRGAQLNTKNRFSDQQYVLEHFEGIDELPDFGGKTEILLENPKSVLNKTDSPDLPFAYSINPYQGCEHGCIYCYARNAHQYWGYSAGLDFEQKIIAKPNAAEILKKQFNNKNYVADSVSLSGNTDCYQPIERKLKITRSLLEVFYEYKHPVGIITKNSLILRDIDLLSEMAKEGLVHVMISITTLREELRLLMEPRTATTKNRLKVIELLNSNGIPTGVMTAPIIPGLNSDEIPELIKVAADCGALAAGYTMVRLNGSVKEIFHDWLYKNLPDAAEKIWNHISETHGGQVNDNRFGKRMRGEGKIAESINQLFKLSVKRHMERRKFPDYNYSLFRRPGSVDQLQLDF